MINRWYKSGNASERSFMPALSGTHNYLVSCRGKRWYLQCVITVWCRNTQARASTLMLCSASTTTAMHGPTSLMATLEWGSPKLYHFCFYFCLQCLHHSHIYTGGGTAGTELSQAPPAQPWCQGWSRHGALGRGEPRGLCPGPLGLGSPWHPDTVKLSQGFKNDVTGGLGAGGWFLATFTIILEGQLID